MIPTRDRRELLPAALRSALVQDGVAVEVVVVDDGSVDGTGELLAELGEPRLRVVRHERSRGLAGARNAGIAVARGAWVGFLDDDDLWAPTKLRRQVEAASRVDADWVYCTALMVDQAGAVVYEWPLPDPGSIADQLLRMNVVPAGSSSVVARTERLRALNGFDERFDRLADWDLWLRLTRAGAPAAVDEPLVAYRRHGGNMSGGGRRAALAELDLLARTHGSELDRPRLERWIREERRRVTQARAETHAAAGRRVHAAGVHLAAGLRGDRRAVRRAAAALRSGAAPASTDPRAPDWVRRYVEPSAGATR